MSLIYPRTITITRPAQKSGVGYQKGYAAETRATEKLVANGVPCTIQAHRDGTKQSIGLPADGTLTTWRILIPPDALARGTIVERDIVTDDLGERYQVTANYWNSLGYRLTVEKLQA